MGSASIFVMALGGMAFYVGVYHLMMYVHGGRQRENVSFALTSFAVGVYDVFCGILYGVRSVDQGVVWQRWQLIILAFVGIFMLTFISDFINRKSRRWDGVFFVYWLIQAAVLAFDRSVLTWSGVPSVKTVRLFGHHLLTYHEVEPGILVNIQGMVGLAALVYAVVSLAKHYRAGNREKTSPVLVGMGFLVASIVNDTAVSSGLYQFVYLVEYGYTALVLSMAYSLCGAFFRTRVALQESEEHYRAIFEEAPVGIFHATTGGEMIHANPAMASILGFESGDRLLAAMVGTNIADRFYMNPWKWQDGVDRILGGEGWFRYEENLRPRKGGMRVVHFTVRGVRTWNGRFLYVEGFAEDVTDSRMTEEALRQSEAKYSALVEQAGDGVIIAQDEVIVFVNAAAEEILGYSFTEIFGKRLSDLVVPENVNEMVEKYKLHVSGKELSSCYEIEIMHRDGAVARVEVSSSLIRYRGRAAVMGIMRDVSEREVRNDT